MSEPAPLDPSFNQEDLRLVQDLKRQSVNEVQKERVHERVRIEIEAKIHPANASDWDQPVLDAMTRDISEGGCGLLMDRPPYVGDVYRLEFDDSKLSIPVVFARCLRCSLVREGAYEAGFVFFSPISLPGNDEPEAEEDLFA